MIRVEDVEICSAIVQNSNATTRKLYTPLPGIRPPLEGPYSPTILRKSSDQSPSQTSEPAISRTSQGPPTPKMRPNATYNKRSQRHKETHCHSEGTGRKEKQRNTGMKFGGSWNGMEREGFNPLDKKLSQDIIVEALDIFETLEEHLK